MANHLFYLTIISIVLAAGALAVAIYSRYQQREIQDRLKRKEQLNDLAGTVENLHQFGNDFINTLREPTLHEDLRFHLDQMVTETLSHYQLTGEEPEIEVEPMVGTSEGRETIDDAERALELYKEHRDLKVLVSIDWGDHDARSSTGAIHQFHWHSEGMYELIELINEEHHGILDEFAPGLLDKIEASIDKILERIFEEYVDIEGEIPFPQHGTVEELSIEVFRTVTWYDGIGEDLDELERLLNQLEEARTNIVQTSYS